MLYKVWKHKIHRVGVLHLLAKLLSQFCIYLFDLWGNLGAIYILIYVLDYLGYEGRIRLEY